ncbi:hypothetical protein ACT3UD_18705, partial [Glutamicibacter sp. 287]|uniref:hypothetical protein n=1 Tax=Glutamicibacter sp. 287 TaxID=3457732 RepID=UPI004033F2B0
VNSFLSARKAIVSEAACTSVLVNLSPKSVGCGGCKTFSALQKNEAGARGKELGFQIKKPVTQVTVQ